jgi:2'-5' RNA ligase
MGIDDTIRTFIACAIPRPILHKIALLQDQLRTYNWKVKWVPVSNIHLTLSFLGDIQRSMPQKIILALDPLVDEQKPFTFSLGNLGVFPGVRRPDVLWIGLSGDIEPLVGFQSRLQDSLRPLGFPVDKRKFKAHLTLGRLKGPVPKNEIAEALCMDISGEKNQFVCNRLVLYQSKLSSKGATYYVLHEWQLGI